MNEYSHITHSWITRVIFGITVCVFGIALDSIYVQIDWQPMTLLLLITGMIASEEIRGGSYKTLGFTFDSYMLKESLFGLLMGIVPSILLISLFAMNTWIELEWNAQFEISAMLPIISLAIIEEMIFRGIIFQALVERFGMIKVSLISAMLFSMAHLANPNFDSISMLNTFLASLVFSYAWFHTRGLWLPILLHISWNLMLYLMGLTLSGMSLQNALFSTTLSLDIPMPWLHSEYGVEGTVFCMLTLILFFPIIHMLPQSPYRMADFFRLNYAIPSASHEGDIYED